jgi:hypothetical protein
MDRFKLIAYGPNFDEASKATCSQVMVASGLADWICGRTKVFLKYWHIEKLEMQLRRFEMVGCWAGLWIPKPTILLGYIVEPVATCTYPFNACAIIIVEPRPRKVFALAHVLRVSVRWIRPVPVHR